MRIVPTRDNILAASSETGLMAYLFDIAGTRALHRDTAFLAAVAELVRTGECAFLSEKDWAFLQTTSGRDFFRGMSLLCELIPFLSIGHQDMMRLVSTLVHLGGQDLAANLPNRALRDWCSAEQSRIRAIIDDARAGEELAIEHLCFALEAGAQISEALEFLRKDSGPMAQIQAATALGRMPLDSESAKSALQLLSEVATNTEEPLLRNNALLAGCAILEGNPQLLRQDAEHILSTVLADPSPETLDVLSELILRHGSSLSRAETESIMSALQLVSAEHHGTIQRIDTSTPNLVSGGHFDTLSSAIAELIRRSKGKLSLNSFPTFRDELITNDGKRFGKLTVDWLAEGNPFLCSSLAEQFSAVEGRSQAFDLERCDLPTGAQDQYFLCRKAVGHLFHAPVAAASIIVSVLRHSDDHIADGLLALLNWPLLASFGGELVDFLNDAVQRHPEPVIVRIQEALAWKKQLIDQLDGIESLVELHPTEIHRHIAQIHSSQQFSQAVKESMKQSILRQLVTTQHILYGETSSIYVQEPEGGTRRVDMEMNKHSVSLEYPQMAIFDPEGLQQTLHIFKFEQRVNP